MIILIQTYQSIREVVLVKELKSEVETFVSIIKSINFTHNVVVLDFQNESLEVEVVVVVCVCIDHVVCEKIRWFNADVTHVTYSKNVNTNITFPWYS